MNIESLISRLETGESLEIEFKAAAGGLPASLWPTASAFANTCGGWIILGVTETKSVFQIAGITNAAGMQQDLANQMRNPQKISTEVCGLGDIQIEKVDGKDIIVVRIRAASSRQKPVYIQNNPYAGTFVRRHAGDYRCSKQEVDRMIRDASSESVDSSILKGYSWEQLDKGTLDRYRQRFRQLSPASPWNDYDDLRFMKALGGHRQDPESGQEGFTRAAYLMFGTREALMTLRPRHLIDFRLVPSNASPADLRWEHRIAWEGNLYDAFFQIYPRLTEPLKIPFQLEGPHRVSETAAHEALREALVNLLAHADYSESAALLVKVSPLEFIFRNPGSSRVAEDDLLTGDHSDPRNPTLLRMFRHVALAEEAGTGLPKILKTWRAAGLELPSITSDTERYEFKLTLRLVHLLSAQDRSWLATCAKFRPKGVQADLPGLSQLSEHEQVVMIHARNQGAVNNASVQAITNLHPADATELLAGLRQRGLLTQQSSGRWAHYRIPDEVRKTYQEKPIKKATPSTMKGKRKPVRAGLKPIKKTYHQKPISKLQGALGSAGPKAYGLANQILSYCKTPRSADEIARELDMNRTYLRVRYLTPLVKIHFLRRTIPAHPKARNQKYVAAKKSL